MSDVRDLPVDPVSSARLAAAGLRYGLVDTADAAAFAAWFQADARGFNESRMTERAVEVASRNLAYRRSTGVWDDTAAEAATPVATVSSWVAELTMPGPRPLPAWAVSSVTVAATHRRRGIARALLEGELRTAHAAGVPVAILTATEATLYERYGFGHASTVADLELDRTRAGWRGPVPPGRVQYVEASELRGQAPEIAARAARATVGEVDRWDNLFDRLFGLVDPEHARDVRTVRYDDEHAVPQGFAAYQLVQRPDAHPALRVRLLTAATEDAYAALWRFFVEHDLVSTLTAGLRSLDEPLPWMLADPHALRWSEVTDQLWVRVLDPVAALSGRRFSAHGALALTIEDPLGFAAGTLLLEVDAAGDASVSRLDAADASPALRLGVAELGSILLGGVRASVLAMAGRIEGPADAVAIADRMFAAEQTPHLGVWF